MRVFRIISIRKKRLATITVERRKKKIWLRGRKFADEICKGFHRIFFARKKRWKTINNCRKGKKWEHDGFIHATVSWKKMLLLFFRKKNRHFKRLENNAWCFVCFETNTHACFHIPRRCFFSVKKRFFASSPLPFHGSSLSFIRILWRCHVTLDRYRRDSSHC